MKTYLIDFQQIDEDDGSLVFMQSAFEIPFVIKRVFYIFNTPPNTCRANHANKKTDFVLVAVTGKVKVEVDDGVSKQIYELTTPNKGLYIPHMTWMRTYEFSNKAVLLVMASEPYDEKQYYEDYEAFLRECYLQENIEG